MTKMSKSAATTLLNVNADLPALANIPLMLAMALDGGYELIQPAHIYKPLKEKCADYDWGAFNARFNELTEKAEGRGWYRIPAETKTTTAPALALVEEGEEFEVPVGVAWAPEKTEDDLGLYVEDEGLKKIALMGANCFGDHQTGNKHCKGCPLAGSCQVAAFAKIADIAALLDEQTLEAMKPAPEVEEDEVAFEEPAEETAKEPTLPEGATVTTTPFTTVCSACDKPIEGGVECVNIRGKGNFHFECVANA